MVVIKTRWKKLPDFEIFLFFGLHMMHNLSCINRKQLDKDIKKKLVDTVFSILNSSNVMLVFSLLVSFPAIFFLNYALLQKNSIVCRLLYCKENYTALNVSTSVEEERKKCMQNIFESK